MPGVRQGPRVLVANANVRRIGASQMTTPEEKLKTGTVRVIYPHRCPHYILVPEHYREDGICKCNDPGALEMREWGYKWSRKKGLWV